MDDQIIPMCNSTKPHLQLQLQQPTKYSLDLVDVEAAKCISPNSEKDINTDDAENKVNEEEGKIEDETGDQSAKNKVPLLYQLVEPGCTAMSCYASIITFFIMLIGVLALLMISPPFSQGNKKNLSFEDLMAKALNGQVFYKNGKVQDTIDVVLSTESPTTTQLPTHFVGDD